MAWEYKIVESTDFGHPGGTPRFGEFLDELSRLSQDGWEVDQLVPTMQRGRAETGEGSSRQSSSLTTVTLLALLKRRKE